jgi:hypothetical protein
MLLRPGVLCDGAAGASICDDCGCGAHQAASPCAVSVACSAADRRCGCGPSRRARAIAGKAPWLVANSRFGPGENSVRVVERPTIPPAIDRRPLPLRRRADPVEGSVANRIAVITEKLTDLLSRETPLGWFNRSHFASPNNLPETTGG